MDDSKPSPSEHLLLALLQPVARLMIDGDLGLAGAVELLKAALVAEAYAQNPDASASQVSLLTGVHRKDIKRLDGTTQPISKTSAAARVLTLWQNEPDYLDGDAPRVLTRDGEGGFDALVKLAKIDAAPATVLSVLLASGNVAEDDGLLRFVTASMVPHDRDEKMRTAIATLVPHLDTTIGNLVGQTQQWDQTLRYSHLSQEAADELEKDAAAMAMDMLQALNKKASELQSKEDGDTMFVAGTFLNKKAQTK